MQFETWEEHTTDEVMGFIHSLPATMQGKLLKKLVDWEGLNYHQLLSSGHVGKVTGTQKAFRLKVTVEGCAIRLYGPIVGHTMYFVHALNKKSEKIPKKDVRIIDERSTRAWNILTKQ